MREDLVAEAIAGQVDQWLPEIRSLRRTLHACPEIALQETKTRDVLMGWLSRLPLDFASPILGTDVVATLDVGARRTVGLRADMDALPISEQTGQPYQSAFPGMMHACGHDGHMAILAGSAAVLCAVRDRLESNVRFIFQPGEEVVCAGRDLVSKGVCDGLDEVYALHAQSAFPVGQIVSRPGPFFAAAGFFEFEFRGMGCHGATPEAGRNPIPVASAVVTRLEALHKRWNQTNGVVISVCRVTAGSMNNIIPGVARVGGTFRYLDAADGLAVQAEMRAVAEELAREAGVEADIEFEVPYQLPVINDKAVFERCARLARRYLPPESFLEAPAPAMIGEDFAFYLIGRPGLMFWLGMGVGSPSLHSPEFDFTDESLRNGVNLFCLLAAGLRA